MAEQEKKILRRQLIAADTDSGRMKIQSIKEELYNASTNAVRFSVQMYSMKRLSEWTQKELEKVINEIKNKVFQNGIKQLMKGDIRGVDISNGRVWIDESLRNKALTRSIGKLEKQLPKVENEDSQDSKTTETDLDGYNQEPQDGETELEEIKKKLKNQKKDEYDALDTIRDCRNKYYAHDTGGDEKEIPSLEEWEPDAGDLVHWANLIVKYLAVIENRYDLYSQFDPDYKAALSDNEEVSKEAEVLRECMRGFNECRVFVQRLKLGLYANQTGAAFEFGGALYEKNDEEHDFSRLIEQMAKKWSTGMRYFAIVTNDDIPEMNVFFRECLSGTDDYVNLYLPDRNALREAYRENRPEADYIYFRMLYRLNPKMENFYWKGRYYTPRHFAYQILYPIRSAGSAKQLSDRLTDYENKLKGVDLQSWCEHRLLSNMYFKSKKDKERSELAQKLENAVGAFCRAAEESEKNRLYKFVTDSAEELYIKMYPNNSI